MRFPVLCVLLSTFLSLSKAQNRDCLVESIPNGIIKLKSLGPAEFNLQTLRKERTEKFENVRIGSILSDSLYLFCDAGYFPQGTGLRNVMIRCSQNGWSPAPVCLPGCYLEDLNFSTGVSPQTDFVTPPGERLSVHCEEEYSPRTNLPECENGMWNPNTESPCAKTCRSDPPPALNAVAEITDFQDGGKVHYSCFQGFMKVRAENVTCRFGEWRGVTATCKDSRCNTDALNFPGMRKGDKTFYRSGEDLEIVCDLPYTLDPEHNGYIKCEDGDWQEDQHPCIPATCSDPPPNIANGKATVTTWEQSSVVSYTCDDPYVPVGNNEVQCLFGKWTGEPPICEDSRCFLKDLKHSAGVSPYTQSTTKSCNLLSVRCTAGYTPNVYLPVCLNGEWIPNFESPCKENECSVRWIPNGDISGQKIGPIEWNWRKYRFEATITFENISYGTIPSREKPLFLFCHQGYIVQGTASNKTLIQCSQGRWSPDPVCIQNVMQNDPLTRPLENPNLHPVYGSTTRSSQRPFLRTDAPNHKVTKSPIIFEEEDILKWETTPNPPASTEEAVEGSCRYTLNDNDVVAYMGIKELKYNDRVKKGSLVNIRCADVGYHKLVGKGQFTCENGRLWRSTEVPACTHPNIGDTVILFDKNVTISLDGALEVRKDQTVTLQCIAIEVEKFPIWIPPSAHRIRVSSEILDRDNDARVYITHLLIENPDQKNEGMYECNVGRNPPTRVEIRVVDVPVHANVGGRMLSSGNPSASSNIRCPEFQDEEKFNISYYLGTRVGSQAIFSCRLPGDTLSGKKVLTCLKNGEWSSNPPECTGESLCFPLTKPSESSLIMLPTKDTYSFGESLTFSCPPGFHLNPGLEKIACLKDGWSEKILPECIASTIFGEDFENDYDVL